MAARKETHSDLRQCPYCKEDIKVDALRCKHCRSTLEPETPGHEGTCPWCKEAIHVEAIKCKHCGSCVGPARKSGDCGCGSKDSPENYAGDVVDLGIIGGAEPGEESPGGIAQAPNSSGCGDCSGFGGTTTINGHTRVRGFRTCCKMIPFWNGGRVIYKKVCWTERCLYRDIYEPL